MTRVLRFRVEKLIRDGLPAMMRAEGLSVFDRRMETDEFERALRDKLVEETAEAHAAAAPRALLEELADVSEVMLALAAVHGFTAADIETARLAKRAARGGFDDRVWNDAVSAPEGAPALAYYTARPGQYPPAQEEGAS